MIDTSALRAESAIRNTAAACFISRSVNALGVGDAPITRVSSVRPGRATFRYRRLDPAKQAHSAGGPTAPKRAIMPVDSAGMS